MKRSIFTKLLITALSCVILLTGTGCFGEETDDTLQYQTPISGWTDIPIPEEAVFVRSQMSGLVENHEYETDLAELKLFEFFEEAMAENGWSLSESFSGGRNFTKNGNVVSVSTKGDGSDFILIIEPQNAYGEN